MVGFDIGHMAEPEPREKRGPGALLGGLQVAVGVEQPIQVHHREAGEVPDDAGTPGADDAALGQQTAHDHRTQVDMGLEGSPDGLVPRIDVPVRVTEVRLHEQEERPSEEYHTRGYPVRAP